MIEIHPFGNFVPSSTKYLLLGSFPAKPSDQGDWFYSNKRNQFWDILEKVYRQKLGTKKQKQKLLKRLHMAMADVILSCKRDRNSNLDTNLTNITYNNKAIDKIIKENNIEKIFFTSRFVETVFKKLFKEIIEKHPKMSLIYLPSPSPRYAAMSRQEKIKRYKKLLPKLNKQPRVKNPRFSRKSSNSLFTASLHPWTKSPRFSRSLNKG